MHTLPVPYPPRLTLTYSPTHDDKKHLPTTGEKIYPPDGLILPWNGIVVVGTSVEKVEKRVLSRDLTQMVISTIGTTIAIQQPQTQAKTYLRGRAEITFSIHPGNYDPEVPIPDAWAVGALWNDIFRKRSGPPGQTCNEGTASVPSPYETYEGEERPANPVSRHRTLGRTTRNLPEKTPQITNPKSNAGVGNGSPEDPIDVDSWIATIEAAMRTAPSFSDSRAPATMGHGRNVPLRDEGATKNGWEPMDHTVSNPDYAIRVIRKRNLHDEQGTEERYDADGEVSDAISISSTESEMTDSEFMEMMEILRTPESHHVQPGTLEACDEGMAEESDPLSSSDDEGLEPGEIEPVDKREDDRMVLMARRQTDPSIAQVQNLTDSLQAEFQRSVDIAVAQAVANAQQPPTPPATPTSTASTETLPSLERDHSGEPWGGLTAVGPWTAKSAWDNPEYATTGQLDELGRQISNLERRLKGYFPDDSPRDSPPQALHNTPYVFWTSHADLEHRVYINSQEIFAHQQRLEAHLMAFEAHALAFEAHQQELSEQLDRRFKGLRDSLALKIRAAEEWIGRNEERIARQEGQGMLTYERSLEDQARVSTLQNALDDANKRIQGLEGRTDLHFASIRTQIAILDQVVGIPSAISPPVPPFVMKASEQESRPTRDPRVTRRRKRIAEDMFAANKQDTNQQTLAP